MDKAEPVAIHGDIMLVGKAFGGAQGGAEEGQRLFEVDDEVIPFFATRGDELAEGMAEVSGEVCDGGEELQYGGLGTDVVLKKQESFKATQLGCESLAALEGVRER